MVGRTIRRRNKMNRVSTMKMNKVSKKRLRTIFKPRFIDNRTELHLLSLGIGGGITEKIDGQYFSIRMNDSNKVDIKTSRSSYEDDVLEHGHAALLEELRTNMFIDMCKVKKRYGSFEFDGELIYAPKEYYDDDNTVTLIATKYHRVRLANLGGIVIRKFKSSNNLSEIEIEEAKKLLQVCFLVHNNFKCYLNDDFCVTEDVDNSIEIPTNCELTDIPNLLDSLAENNKSMLNGKLNVQGCEVEGYVFYADGVPYSIINKRWKALKEKYLEKYNVISDKYSEMMKGGEEKINEWIEYAIDFLSDDTVPRGVRFTKRQRIHGMLSKLGQKFNVSIGNYIYLVNKILMNPKQDFIQ